MMMKSKIKILLADDHLVVRMGLAAIIGLETDFKLVGEASDGLEAVRLAEELKPDVIIMDLLMPRLDGVAATEQILKSHPDAKILILTSFGDSEDINRALEAGALGALVKDSDYDDLITAVRTVYEGKRILCPAIERQLNAAPQKPELKPRQLEILQYVAKGLNNREIAQLIGIGPDCVKAHLGSCFTRLGASSRSEAVAIALQHHLLKI